MIQAEYPPKLLQEIMGHASITTTLDLNGHLYPGDMDLSFHVDSGPSAWHQFWQQSGATGLSVRLSRWPGPSGRQ